MLPSFYALVFQESLFYSLLTHTCHIPCLPHDPRYHCPNNLTVLLQTPHVVYCTFNCRSTVQKCQPITSNLLPLTTKHFISLNALYFRALKGLRLYMIADSIYLIWTYMTFRKLAS